MRRVILESPYAGKGRWPLRVWRTWRNVAYARRAVRDALLKGEAPIASHLLYRRGVLDDRVPEERRLGIGAGLAWVDGADAMVVYVDRGVSPGMRAAIEVARTHPGLGVEFRSIERSRMGDALRRAAEFSAAQNNYMRELDAEARQFESVRWQGPYAVPTARPSIGFSARLVR